MEAPLLKSGHVPFVNAGRFIGDIYSGGESIGFRPTAVMNLSSFVGDYPGITEARTMLPTSLPEHTCIAFEA